MHDAEQFYPTPKPLADRMAGELIKSRPTTILEPSAGDGALIKAYHERFHLHSRLPPFYVCEIDPARRSQLAIDGHRIIGADFLESRVADYYYDGVIMNPPFRNGLKHVRHAYEHLAPGGTIVALINAAQIANSSQADYAFFTELTNNGMEVEEIEGAFKDADRKTSVRCALLVAKKPKDAKKEEDFSNIWQKLNDERAKVANGGEIPQEEGLVAYNVIQDIVARYNASLNHHETVLRSHKEMRCILPISVSDDVLKFPACFSNFEKELRDRCWDRIFRETGVSDIMTKSIRNDFQEFCATQKRIEFTVENIEQLCANLAGDLNRIRERACRELFEKFTRYHEDNAYSGWKTNSSWRVGDKIILPNWFECDWSGGTVSMRYHYADDADDIEKTLCLLTGRRLKDVHDKWANESNRRGYVRSSLHLLGSKVETGVWHDSEFFTWKCFKKGTVHLKWKCKTMQKDFNELASRGDVAVGFGR